MRNTYRLLLLLTAAALAMAAMSSCRKIDDKDIVGKNDLKGTVIRQYFWEDKVSPQLQKLFDSFKQETGITIENIKIPYANLDMKYMLDISAGTQPDVLYLSDERYPKYIIRGFAQDMTQYQDYFDKNSAYWNLVKKNSKFLWKGKIYGASYESDPFLLIYNRTLFEENDVKTPLAYYNEGEWNWKTFAEVGKKLTDTKAELKRYGFGTWRFDLIVASGGGKLLEFTDDGNINLKIDSAQTINCLNFMKDAQYTDKWMDLISNSWLEDFKQGRCAMIGEGLWLFNSVLKDMKFEIDFVPFPLGPDNTDQMIPANTSSLGITTGAKNPYGVMAYLEYRYKYFNAHKQEGYKNANLTQDQIDRYEKIKKMPFITAFTNGVGDLAKKQYGVWDAILFRGEEVATVVNEQKSVWQNEINAALKDKETMPTIQEFKAPPKITFEDDTYKDYLSFTDKDGKPIGDVTAEIITKEQGGIDGKSVKFSFKKNPTGFFMLFDTTDKIVVQSYKTYEISFDYKILKDMGNSGSFNVSILSRNSPQDGSVREDKITGKKAGDSGHYSCKLDLFDGKPDYCFGIIGLDAGDIVIDNISITALGD